MHVTISLTTISKRLSLGGTAYKRADTLRNFILFIRTQTRRLEGQHPCHLGLRSLPRFSSDVTSTHVPGPGLCRDLCAIVMGCLLHVVTFVRWRVRNGIEGCTG